MKQQKQKETPFIKLKVGETVSGKFNGFYRNKYGLFIQLKTGKTIVNLSLNIVLQNIFRTIYMDLKDEDILEIERLECEKNYRLYTVKVNGNLIDTNARLPIDKIF